MFFETLFSDLPWFYLFSFSKLRHFVILFSCSVFHLDFTETKVAYFNWGLLCNSDILILPKFLLVVMLYPVFTCLKISLFFTYIGNQPGTVSERNLLLVNLLSFERETERKRDWEFTQTGSFNFPLTRRRWKLTKNQVKFAILLC